MSEAGFQIGDVVFLNSGGPAMTVSKTNDKNQVLCVWFPHVTAEKPNEWWFAEAVLRKPPPRELGEPSIVEPSDDESFH